MSNYSRMNKAELIERLNKIDNFDEETLLIAAVVAAVSTQVPYTYESEDARTRKRARIRRAFRHVAERYGVTL